MTKNMMLLAAIMALMTSCGGSKNNDTASTASTPASVAETPKMAQCPAFSADTAFAYVEAQCAFGPRVTDTEASHRCGDYLVGEFKRFGCEVTEQKGEVTIYDGTKRNMRNIIASINPEAENRMIICAHWDCRPWADNDPNPANHHTPILAANDAASGVAVMLEMARCIQQQQVQNLGVDFICFDAEDLGTPDWYEGEEKVENTWCLGSEYWKLNPHKAGYRARFGVLLDMVGGLGSTFCIEGYSKYYAGAYVQKIWRLAADLGYGQFFPMRDGGVITDDHVQVNEARIPCVDIIPYYEGNRSSAFGPTWHTVNDTPENIDRNVLKAVGQTLLQLIYNEDK